MCATVATEEIEIREELLSTDRAPIERFIRASGFFRDDEAQVAMELIDDRLAKGARSDYLFLVAARNGLPIGYCCYGRIPCTLHSYDLYWIVVDPQFQRAGLGRRLMAAAEERIRAAGGRRIYVETSGRRQYEPTRRFYERCGYRVEAVLEEFYAPGDAKVVMVKRL